MVIEFERMNNIAQYRTPVALRAYSSVFLNSFPIIYAPYFAHLIHETTPLVGYGVAVLYALVLVSLDNIQEALENPFDEFGKDADDINLDVARDYVDLL
jgi:predicted membrane chloride channel (bestrophin family)